MFKNWCWTSPSYLSLLYWQGCTWTMNRTSSHTLPARIRISTNYLKWSHKISRVLLRASWRRSIVISQESTIQIRIAKPATIPPRFSWKSRRPSRFSGMLRKESLTTYMDRSISHRTTKWEAWSSRSLKIRRRGIPNIKHIRRVRRTWKCLAR